MKVRCLMQSFVPVALAAGIGIAAASPVSAQDAGAMTLVLGRITDLENQMLSLTNRIEQLDYQVRELSSRVELLSRDVDFRFSELGAPSSGASSSGGTSGGGTSGGGGSTAPTPPLQLQTPALEGGTQGSVTGVTPPQISGGSTTAATTAGTPEAEFQAIRGLLDSRDYPAADAALRKFIGDHPNHPLASSAFFWLGEIYFERADYQRAAETYAAGFANYPNGYKAADTLLKLSLSLIELGRPSDGCTTLNQLRTAFPNAPINIQQRADQARASAGCG